MDTLVYVPFCGKGFLMTHDGFINSCRGLVREGFNPLEIYAGARTFLSGKEPDLVDLFGVVMTDDRWVSLS